MHHFYQKTNTCCIELNLIQFSLLFQEAKTEPYSFEYDIKDDYGGSQSRREESDGRNVKGSYGYKDFNGLYRKVDYIADEKGFRAYVKTNEPGIGTDSQNPADVQIQAYASPIQYESSASNEKENVYSAPAEQPESQPVASYETVPGGSFQSQEYRSASEEAYLTEYKSEENKLYQPAASSN